MSESKVEHKTSKSESHPKESHPKSETHKSFTPQTGQIPPSSGKGQPDANKAVHTPPLTPKTPDPTPIHIPTTLVVPAGKLALVKNVLITHGMDSQQADKALKEITSILEKK